jgi:hypothetical protein
MGQYNLRDWSLPSDQPRSFKKHLMTVVKKLVTLVGVKRGEIILVASGVVHDVHQGR